MFKTTPGRKSSPNILLRGGEFQSLVMRYNFSSTRALNCRIFHLSTRTRKVRENGSTSQNSAIDSSRALAIPLLLPSQHCFRRYPIIKWSQCSNVSVSISEVSEFAHSNLQIENTGPNPVVDSTPRKKDRRRQKRRDLWDQSRIQERHTIEKRNSERISLFLAQFWVEYQTLWHVRCSCL